MPAVNPQGSQKYWFNGLPFEGVAKTTPIDEGTQKYWMDGMPGESLYPSIDEVYMPARMSLLHTGGFVGRVIH